jgi:hypothetical protein
MCPKMVALILLIACSTACKPPQPASQAQQASTARVEEQSSPASLDAVRSMEADLAQGTYVPLSDRRVRTFVRENEIPKQLRELQEGPIDPSSDVGDLITWRLLIHQPRPDAPRTTVALHGGPERLQPDVDNRHSGPEERPDVDRRRRESEPTPARQPSGNESKPAPPAHREAPTTTRPEPPNSETESFDEKTERLEKAMHAEKNPYKAKLIEQELAEHLSDPNH